MYRNLSEFIARLEREGELQRVSVPVFLPRSVGSIFSSSPFLPVICPRSKWREYLFPSRQTVTSIYSDEY